MQPKDIYKVVKGVLGGAAVQKSELGGAVMWPYARPVMPISFPTGPTGVSGITIVFFPLRIMSCLPRLQLVVSRSLMVWSGVERCDVLEKR